MSRVAHSHTMSRMKNKPVKPDPKPPERKATSRTAAEERADKARAEADARRAEEVRTEVVPPFRAANALRAEREAATAVEAKPVVLREPAPAAKVANVFVYVNGQRRDVPADTLAATLGKNVRHTDAGLTAVTATEVVAHSMKYLADSPVA